MHSRDDVEEPTGHDGADGTTPAIGLWADPGMPRRVAARIADDLAAQVSEAVGAPLRVEIAQGELPLSPDGTIPVLGRAPRLRHQHDWDYLVYLTDLPRYTEEGRPVLCETDVEEGVALISLPALGAARVRRRARRLAATLVAALHESRAADPTAIAAASGGARVKQTRSEEGGVLLSAAEGPLTGARVLAGMLRSNRPGRLLPALTGCLAVAVAAGAFGIFYGTLATVADPLSIPRMLLISALVISLLTAWLILRNGLWSTRDDPSQMWRRHLDNASTVITVGASVVLLYLLVVLLMLIFAVTVLHTSYLRSEMMHPAGVGDYIGVAWLSASVGTLAGALGANFDDPESVREATYSQRYHERRELFDTYQQQREKGERG